MATSPRIEELRKKFDENPRRYFAPLANEYRKVGDFDQAIFICQEYLPQQPGHMSGHIVFGQALFEAKRFAEAKTVFETALTLDPENLIALRHLGDISRELGEVDAAKTWYERVLQADPRNEEIGAIMATMTAAPAPAPTPPSAAAPTPPAVPKAAPVPAPGSPAAPTMELSAAAVQELVNARKAAQGQAAAPAPQSTLDDAMTIELTPPPVAQALEGLEPTSHEGPIETASHSILDAPISPATLEAQPASILDPAPTTPEMMDLPAGGMLGLEPTSMELPEPTPAPAPSLAAPTVEEFAIDLPATLPVSAPPTAEVPAAVGDGMLDLEPLELDMPPALPAAAAPGAAETPVDGGHDGLMDLEIDVPAAAPVAPPAKPSESVPTIVMEAIKETVAPVLDVVEGAMPAILDVVQEAVPAVVEAATAMPTIIMDAITLPSSPKEPAKKPVPLDASPTQQIDVKSVLAEVQAKRASPPAEPPAEKGTPFVTETMAQLYLEQGHRDKALEIYRQLVAAKPQDADLKKRLETIERSVAHAAAPIVPPEPSKPAAPATAPARFNRAGPGVRTVLRELFGIDSSATHSNGHGAPTQAPVGERGSIDTLFSTDDVEEMSPLAAAFDGGYVAPPGSIDSVFTGG